MQAGRLRSQCISHHKYIMNRAIRIIFWIYWAALTFLLLIHNPFAYVPLDEEEVYNGFGLGLGPHFLTFMMLAILMCACRWKRVWVWWCVLVAYACLTEVVQGFTGRSPDVADAVQNLLGLACGAAGWGLAHLVRGRRS